jgi:DNA-binding LacI/PurR family transcriptional regulator/DNA-binding transcriptional regulator YhcF (GntR family)
MSIESILENDIPKYLAIANEFRDGIKSRKYKPGALLPGDRTLSLQLGCSRPTLQKAFDILEREGHLRKIHGSGVYVDNDKAQEEIHPPFNIENLSIIGIAFGETIENHSGKLTVHHIVDTLLESNGKNSKYEPLCISFINVRELKTKLRYYRDMLAGLIILSPSDYESISDSVQYAQKLNIPTVFAGLQIPSQLNQVPVDTVSVDEFKGGYDVGKYFIEKGHTEIGFVHDGHHKKLGRYNGFITALKESGLKAVTPLDVLKSLSCQPGKLHFFQKLGAACMGKLMKGKKRPTAIICQNDLCAIGAFEELNRMKITMPDEVELFGFGDDMESRLFFSDRTNPISTVGVSRKKLAEESFKLLVRRMNSPGLPPQFVALPTKIIHRETTTGGNISGSKSGKYSNSDPENDIEFINKQIIGKIS